jgi:hypothetical protein
MFIAFLLLIQLLFAVNAFSLRLIPFRLRTPSRLMMSVPLELEGQLDPTKSWEVKLIFDGKEKIVNVPEDCSMLEAGEKVFDGVNSSCRNGVCTTCSGQVYIRLLQYLLFLNLSFLGGGRPRKHFARSAWFGRRASCPWICLHVPVLRYGSRCCCQTRHV